MVYGHSLIIHDPHPLEDPGLKKCRIGGSHGWITMTSLVFLRAESFILLIDPKDPITFSDDDWGV